MEAMTLEAVRDWLRESAKHDGSETTRRWHGCMADAIDAHLAQPAQAVDVGADFGAMNRALCDFAMRWEIDGDYMRCLKCKRPQITNYASHDFPHAHGCKAAGNVEARPWVTFAQLLSPLTRALSAEKAGWRDMDSAPRDGTDILLYAPACEYQGKPCAERVTVGHWTTDEECRIDLGDCGGECHCREYEYGDQSWISWDGGFLAELPPTHWMPLPASPTPDKE